MNYKITFTDGTTFKGEEPLNSKWNDMPEKAIKKFEYFLNSKTIVFEGYEAYNHIVEHTKYVNKSLSSTYKLMLMVKKGENVLIIKPYLIGKIEEYYDVKPFGQEYHNKPLKGWKQGVNNGKPKMEIL